jgi:hypothetical protein
MDERNINDYLLVKQSGSAVTVQFPYKENGAVSLRVLDESIQDAIKQHSDPDSPFGDKELSQVIGKATQVLRDLEQGWLQKLIGKITAAKPERPPVRFYKSAGGVYNWIGSYSNKWLDDDRPVREIISEQSHKAYTKMVEFGVVPPPALWLHHQPGWKIGEATWVAYDDQGFALAGGRAYPEHNDLIDHIKTLDLALSHGMSGWSIRRDPDHPHVITNHITEEITVLLDRRLAANKMTEFYVIGRDDRGEHEETNNMVDPTIRQQLVEEFGVPSDLLDAVEQHNAQKASAADSIGLPSKQVGADEEVEAETAEEETANEAPVKEVTEAAAEETVEETVQPEAETKSKPDLELVGAVVKIAETVAAQNEQIAALTKQIGELQQAEEVRLTQKMVQTPLASAMALLEKSAVGHEETRVDGRTRLGKSAPEEAEADNVQRVTGIPFVDQMLGQQSN